MATPDFHIYEEDFAAEGIKVHLCGIDAGPPSVVDARPPLPVSWRSRRAQERRAAVDAAAKAKEDMAIFAMAGGMVLFAVRDAQNRDRIATPHEYSHKLALVFDNGGARDGTFDDAGNLMFIEEVDDRRPRTSLWLLGQLSCRHIAHGNERSAI